MIADGATGSGVEKFQVRYRMNSAIDAATFDAADTTKLPDVNAVPTLHVFGPDGRRLASRYGAAPSLHGDLETAIREALRAH